MLLNGTCPTSWPRCQRRVSASGNALHSRRKTSKAGTVAVNTTVVRLKGRRLTVKPTKSSAGMRTLALPLWCLQMLRTRPRTDPVFPHRCAAARPVEHASRSAGGVHQSGVRVERKGRLTSGRRSLRPHNARVISRHQLFTQLPGGEQSLAAGRRRQVARPYQNPGPPFHLHNPDSMRPSQSGTGIVPTSTGR
jgi:hypothetical protein